CRPCIPVCQSPLSFSLLPPPPTSTVFPYTTLFRSLRDILFPFEIEKGLFIHAFQLTFLAHILIICIHAFFDTAIIAYLSITEPRSEEHTSELQSRFDLVCRLLLEKKQTITSMQLET